MKMIDRSELFDIAIASAKPTHSDEWVRNELSNPPTWDRFSWAANLPDELLSLWDDLTDESRIVAFWIAQHYVHFIF
jgi:hypothetical protein